MIWSSSRKCSFCKHLMMIFSASWSSGRVTLSIDFSTYVLDLVTRLSCFLISLLWSLDFRCKHRAMTFMAWYQLDTPYSLLILEWPGNEATILTFVVKTDTFFHRVLQLISHEFTHSCRGRAAANSSLGIVLYLRGVTRAFPTLKEQWARSSSLINLR